MASSMLSFSSRSCIAGSSMSARRAVAPAAAPRAATVAVHASRVCDLTGTKRNKANRVCFSNKKSRKWQEPNLQEKKVYWEFGQRWVKLKICTRAIKTLEKNGLDAMAREAGIDLMSLPYQDARPARLAYLEANAGKVPVAANDRAMRDAKKIAASTKKPRYPVYEEGGRIVYIRPGMEESIFGKKEAAPEAAGEAELKITLSQ